jgi:uracil-DNA glycosylase
MIRPRHVMRDRAQAFNIECRRCERLARHLAKVRAEFTDYHARPVAPFGAEQARLLVVGLAPGMHGANRTGRPFTGDYAGVLLYETLHRYGLASSPVAADARDGLRLFDCRITNAVKCLPPENKPTTDEVRRCNGYLRTEIEALPQDAAILALGTVAHRAVLVARGLRAGDFPFKHGQRHALPDGLALYDSYHCSRYNTQTGRLTAEMFRAVVARIVRELAGAG